MSLPRPEDLSVPEETIRAARAAFPEGNRYLALRDALGPIYADEDFADLYPHRGQPALAPWRLALVTVFQFMEHLSDRQAADAVRSRIDWKYALGLRLTDPGFDHSVLTEFRTRLLRGSAEERLLDRMLERLREAGYVKARRRFTPTIRARIQRRSTAMRTVPPHSRLNRIRQWPCLWSNPVRRQ